MKIPARLRSFGSSSNPHEGVDLAAADREVDAAEDLRALSFERDVEVAYLEQVVRHLQLSCLTGGKAS
jgi:hypothetical protein